MMRAFALSFVCSVVMAGAAVAQEPAPPASAPLHAPPSAGEPHHAARPRPRGPFEAEIEAYKVHDAAGLPPACANLFVGSSTIRRWSSLAADMRPLPVINRGFGGSQIAHVNMYFDEIVAPYHPRAIVFYSGDNDIHAGKTPDQVYADFEAFLARKDRMLGSTPVYLISVKPSASRIHEMPQQAELNRKFRALARSRQDVVYLDIVGSMLRPDGRPKDLFFADGLHMRSVGYDYWIPVVRAALTAPPPTHAPGC